MLADLTARLERRADLSPDEVAAALAVLTDESAPVADKAAFLAALATKGETDAEITAFAAGLRERAVPLLLSDSLRAAGVLDVVGTGGDRAGTVNLSTAAALLAAAAGVPVAKHGNRAVTSRSGSADVLQALGVPIDPEPSQAVHMLAERGFVFLFAPRYHPAFKAIAPARRLCAERGQRTLFNLLGPLLNPARPAFQLMGVAAPAWCAPMALALQRLGVRCGLVACGEAGPGPDGRPVYVDEFLPWGVTRVAEFRGTGPVQEHVIDAAHFGLRAASLDDLRGGDAAANAGRLHAVLSGADRGPVRDAVLLNAAAALYVAGRASSINEGLSLAGRLVDDGTAERKLQQLTQPLSGAD